MAYKKQRDGVLMWDKIIGILPLLWDVVTDSRLDDAKKEAHMWQSLFWIAVIVIVILVVIMICKNTDDRE